MKIAAKKKVASVAKLDMLHKAVFPAVDIIVAIIGVAVSERQVAIARENPTTQILRNYLLPRECPRVTYYTARETTAADMERFLGSSPAVIVVEGAWLERLRSCRPYCYHLPPETFECTDECAGYIVSRVPVVPSFVRVFDDLLAALLRRGVELRFAPNLWPLRDAVVSSTLRFSLIRMRNALPRQTPDQSSETTASSFVALGRGC